MTRIELFDLAMDIFSLLHIAGDRTDFPLGDNLIDQALFTLNGNLTPDLDEGLTFSTVGGRTNCDQFPYILDAAIELDLVELSDSSFKLKLTQQNTRINAVRSRLSTEEFTAVGQRLLAALEEEERFQRI